MPKDATTRMGMCASANIDRHRYLNDPAMYSFFASGMRQVRKMVANSYAPALLTTAQREHYQAHINHCSIRAASPV